MTDSTLAAVEIQGARALPEVHLGPLTTDANAIVVGFRNTSPSGTPTLELGPLPVDLSLDHEDGPELHQRLYAVLEHHQATGAAGEVVVHVVPRLDDSMAVVMVSVGAGTPNDLRKAGAAAIRAARGKTTVASALGAGLNPPELAAYTEGLILGGFAYSLKTSLGHDTALQVHLVGVADELADGQASQAVVAQAGGAARASALSRTLALVPSNIKNPSWLAAQAERLGRAAGLDVEIFDEQWLNRAGCGGILGVGQASASPPRLVKLTYTPAKTGRATPHVVLVGKGITFDTGGLSLKPSDSMSTMKRDMTGAGVVTAVMCALGELGCEARVTALLALAENAVGSNSIRPGDVVVHYGGRTTEVTNTDAEGRLVMADALAYAVAKLKPTMLIDVATLTGAVKIALGLNLGGLFCNDDTVADALTACGAESGEPVWRLPLESDYRERMDSKIADADNAGGGPGAITAALFLEAFTAGLPWAHLDLASVGDSPVDAFEYSAGATGFGARLLLNYLRSPSVGKVDS